MDQSSSIYVDQIVIKKLIEDKLSKVHHFSELSYNELKRPVYQNFFTIEKTTDLYQVDDSRFYFNSPLIDQFEENNKCYVNYYTNESNTLTDKASIIFLHGLYDDNRDIYQFLFKNLMTDYHIYLMTLPYHFERKPKSSLFGGEYFWSAKLERSMFAFEQGIYELKQMYYTVKKQTKQPVYIAAFSMGAGIAQGFATLDHQFDGMFLINPVCSLSEIVLDSELCKTVKADLLNSSITIEQVLDIYSQFDPYHRNTTDQQRKMGLGYGLYDQITSPAQYEELTNIWHFQKIIKYKSGHLNILRVPRLAKDIHDYFQMTKS
ncbi:MAG: hypothetical protein JXR70_10370 [Spirochaetales bacterium]|nr:hypothetical protein [Spirochaetales bacterium]